MSIAEPAVATAERLDDAPMVHGNAAVHERYLRAIALSRDGRDDEAEMLLRTVLAEQPNHAGAVAALGCVLSAPGRIEEGLAFYDRSLALRPDDRA